MSAIKKRNISRIFFYTATLVLYRVNPSSDKLLQKYIVLGSKWPLNIIVWNIQM